MSDAFRLPAQRTRRPRTATLGARRLLSVLAMLGACHASDPTAPTDAPPQPAIPTGPAAPVAPSAPAVPPATDSLVAPRNVETPDIVLISLDTTRVDRLGFYGYERATTPNLSALAARGIRFERAYSTSSWTVPAVVSMLSGRNPAWHGVRTGIVRAGKVTEQPAIPADVPLLAEYLQRAGYRTFGVVNNSHLAAGFGFDRGFSRYSYPGFLGAPALEAELEPWLRELQAPKPYFLWLHFIDPHAPLVAAEPWLTEFWPRDKPRFPELSEVKHAPGFSSKVRTAEERGYVDALYDAEIAFMDAAIGRVLAKLPDRPKLVLVTADHGEELYDRQHWGHGNTLYDEVVRVPMLVVPPRDPAAPSAHGARVSKTLVSLIDVLPTLLSAAHIPTPPDLPGLDLLSIDEAAAERRVLDLELSRNPRGASRGAIRWPFKAVLIERNGAIVHNLAADPGERTPLPEPWPQEVTRLGQAIDAQAQVMRQRRHAARGKTLDPKRARQLEALGYVTEQAAPEAPAPPRPAP